MEGTALGLDNPSPQSQNTMARHKELMKVVALCQTMRGTTWNDCCVPAGKSEQGDRFGGFQSIGLS